MLTLNFENQITVDSGYSRPYYNNINELQPVPIKFSTLSPELPYIMTANPSLHKKDMLHFTSNDPFGRRGINMIKLKEVVENGPVCLKVKFLSSYYLVGKGFIARILSASHTPISRIELLFVVAAERGKAIGSPHDLKIYLNREMYEAHYKRVMSFLKPYMAEHRGDIVVTKSINDYFVYQFKLPSFKEMEDRVKFDDNIKDFFIRSIKWTQWRKDEEKRLAELERIRREERVRREREIAIQDGIQAILEAEELRTTVANPVIELEAVEELPAGELAAIEEHLNVLQGMAASMREEMSITEQRIEIPIGRDRRSHIHREQAQPTSFQPTSNLPQQPMSHGLEEDIQDIQPQVQSPQEVPISSLEEEDIQEELSEPQIQPQLNPDAVAMTEEEMQRIMNQFSIAAPVIVEYTVRNDPATGIPLSQIIEENDEEMEINDDTEVVLEDGEDDDGTEEPSEDDLDNDPDAYEDAVLVEGSDPLTLVVNAMVGGRME